MSRVPTRLVWVSLLVVALLLAGVVSLFASSSPDGLERVATDQGFSDTAGEHATADGPLADYQASGIDDDRLSGAVAGVTGALVTLVLAGGLALVLRRRGGASAEDGGPDRAGSDEGAGSPTPTAG